jgi:glycosyltransferase involved in cell wall biosynthesis
MRRRNPLFNREVGEQGAVALPWTSHLRWAAALFSQRQLGFIANSYDMIPEQYPGFFKKNPDANKLDWFNSSDLIISISDSSASGLAYFRPDLESRIRRIHLYSVFTTKPGLSRPVTMDKDASPYVLFAGSRGSYKNASMLVRAFAASDPSRHGYRLVFPGGGVLTNKELAIIDLLKIDGFIDQINVRNTELWYLYKNSKAVVVPSMAEGFSLPLVESLTADIPTICSDIPVHQEVASNFASLVNPMKHNDWSDILGSINNLQRPFRLLGELAYREPCYYYSRDRMVEEHIMTYKTLLP